MLLNIDKPLKKATLHNEFCGFVPKPVGPKLKPFGRIGPDGGWFSVTSEQDAARFAAHTCPQSTFVRCPRC